MPQRRGTAVLAAAVLVACTGSTKVTISNAQPRLDSRGAIMDCHDGNILHIDGVFWNFCMAYGSCHNKGCASDDCGGRLDHNISIYSSPNLTSGSWSYVADLLPYDKRLSGTYYRPKVVFNPKTKKYVFWVNVLPRASWSAPVDFSKSSYLVATSDSPGGHYTVAVQNATTKFGEGGDFSLFVDDDGSGFLIYTSLAEAHSISIAPLNSAFTQSLPEHNTAFLPGTNHTGCFEAPAMFKRNNVYYALASICSCFGAGGADVWVYTAPSPLGPYTRRGSLGNAEHAQQNYIFEVPLASLGTNSSNRAGEGEGQGADGDRWKSTPDGQKGHDFQYWQPLTFNDAPPSPAPTPTPSPHTYVICPDCHPSDPVYFVDERTSPGTLHHIRSCVMSECGTENMCLLAKHVPPTYIANHTHGSEFSCGMDPQPPPSQPPIAALHSASELPSFVLDIAA